MIGTAQNRSDSVKSERNRMKKIIKALCLVVIILLIYLNIGNLLKIAYKIEYSDYVNKYSVENNLDPFLVYAIIKAESNFNAGATSSKGACGLMQLMDNTAKEVATIEGIDYESGTTLYNPEKNIKIGTKYYSALKSIFKNNEVALAAYNAGSGNVKKWINEGIIQPDGSNIENIPFKETNIYVRKILKNYKIYKDLYSLS